MNSTNKGRSASISVQGMTIVENIPFDCVVYDSIRKENGMLLALDGFIHLVNDPEEIYMTQDYNGVVCKLEILCQNGLTTFLNLS